MAEAPLYLTYDDALERAQAVFDDLHPRASLPDWFGDLVGRYDTLTKDQHVELRYFIQPELPLAEDQVWAATEYGPRVMFVLPVVQLEDGTLEAVENPDHSTRSILTAALDRQPPSPRTIFRATVDPMTGEVEIHESLNLQNIDLNDLEPPGRFKLEFYADVVAHWIARPTLEQAEQLRGMFAHFHQTMPSRIIREALKKEPLNLGTYSIPTFNRLVLALKPLGLTVDIR